MATVMRRRSRRRVYRVGPNQWIDDAQAAALAADVADDRNAGPAVGPALPVPWPPLTLGPSPQLRGTHAGPQTDSETRRQPGRPRLGQAQQGPAPQLRLRVPPDLADAVRAKAAAEELPLSVVLRRLLEQYVRAD